MSQVTEQSVRFQTALASIKLIQASAVLDLTEDDFDFLTSNKVWIATPSTLPSIKLRKCSSKIITSILSFISGRLATKSNQIKQLIRNGRSASLQRTFKKSFTS